MKGVIALNGGYFILVDKPENWTSFDVVAKVKSITGIQKVGHAGSLDPMATGLLVVAAGPATKLLGEGLSGSKSYRAKVQLGLASSTWDAETEDPQRIEIPKFQIDDIKTALEIIKGRDFQVPPMFAALKRKGQTLYQLARKGWWLEREERPVEISELSLYSYLPESGIVEFNASGGGGLYIRTIARDLGLCLGIPAALSALRRTVVSEFKVENATTVEELAESWTKTI